ncbi:MAG TPA: hypothetical protein VFC71_04460 [Candidatus Polarisedimenticolia bacterium]|nr:hypothetical protein [Candidatus Polarisedimenticolia bacterium]
MPERLPRPGPSFLRELDLEINGRTLSVGMSRPTDGPDGTWLAVLWVADDDGVISFRDVTAAAGPPPDPPLARLGPLLTGGLSGLVREEAGRLAIRLAPVAPPDDPDRPWRAPFAIRAAIGFEPLRAATMRPNELASSVLTAFRSAVRALGPGSTVRAPRLADDA